jgi:hypothetical protein
MPEPVVDLDVVSGAEPVMSASVGGDVLDAVDEQLIARLAGRAREGGLQLTGEGGLLVAADQAVGGGRAGRRDHRPPRL